MSNQLQYNYLSSIIIVEDKLNFLDLLIRYLDPTRINNFKLKSIAINEIVKQNKKKIHIYVNF